MTQVPDGDLRTRVQYDQELVVRDDACPGLATRLGPEIADRVGRTGAKSCPSLNVCGWKSDALHLWSTPAAIELVTFLRARLTARDIDAWAMINWAGSHHPRHIHHGIAVAGVYYVTTGDDSEAVPTVFERPDGSVVHVDPVVDRLVVFPGRMPHWVPPYQGMSPRVTIAFNVHG